MPRRIILLENGLSSASTPNGAKSIGLLSGSLFLKDSNNVTTPVFTVFSNLFD